MNEETKVENTDIYYDSGTVNNTRLSDFDAEQIELDNDELDYLENENKIKEESMRVQKEEFPFSMDGNPQTDLDETAKE